MQARDRIRFLIFFAILTSFGSSLSAIGTFLALGREFHEIQLVATALAVKTLSSVLITRFTRVFVLKYDVYPSLLISQLSGIPPLLLLVLGFYLKNSTVILVGMFFTGFSGNLLSLVFTPMVKELSQYEDIFKKWQGIQQIFLGFGALLAGFLSPWILDRQGVNGLYFVDGSTFLIAGFCLWLRRKWYCENCSVKSILSPRITLEQIKLKDQAELKALVCIVPSFFFTGLIPIVASSGMQALLMQPAQLVERLWMAESISNIVIGWAYFKYKILRVGKIVIFFPLFCAVPLFTIYLSHSAILFYSTFLIYSILYLYGFTRYRDDLISSAQDLEERVNHSAFHLFIVNLIRTLSAPVVSILISYESSRFVGVPLRAIILIQLLMGGGSFLYLQRSSNRITA